MNVRQNTARTIEVGPILNEDGTPYITDDLDRTDFRVSKNGTSGSLNASATVAHVTGDLQGMFAVALTASDVDTLGVLQVSPNSSGLAGSAANLNVVTQDAWDALHTTNAGGFGVDWARVLNKTTTNDLSGTTIGKSPATLDWDADVANKPTIGTSTFDHTNDQVIVATVNDKSGYALSSAGILAIWQAAVASITTAGSIGKRIVDYLTGDAFARLGAPAGASVSADIAAVKNETASILDDTDLIDDATSGLAKIATDVAAILEDTNELQGNQGNWLTATGFSTHSASDVWSVATRVLTANTNLNDPTAAAIADAVWDEVLSGHLTAGTTGNALNAAGASGDPWSASLPGAYGEGTAGYILGTNIDATVSSRLASSSYTAPPSAASIRIEIDNNSTQLAAIVEDTGELQTNQGNWTTATGYSTHSAADVVNAINANATQITLQTNAANAASSASTAATQATTAATQATAANGIVGNVTYGNSALKTLIDGAKTSADSAAASASSAATAAGTAATAATGAKTSADAVATVLDDVTELNAGAYRFTSAALAQAPGGEASVQVTVSAASVAAQAAADGGKITIRTHSTYRAQITGLGSLSGRSDLLFALKVSVDDTDDESELLISENVGLLRVAGEAAADASKASITVDDADDGDVTIELDESITAMLTPRKRRPWSIKLITSGGDANELTSADIESTHADVIRGTARTYTATS